MKSSRLLLRLLSFVEGEWRHVYGKGFSISDKPQSDVSQFVALETSLTRTHTAGTLLLSVLPEGRAAPEGSVNKTRLIRGVNILAKSSHSSGVCERPPESACLLPLCSVGCGKPMEERTRPRIRLALRICVSAVKSRSSRS